MSRQNLVVHHTDFERNISGSLGVGPSPRTDSTRLSEPPKALRLRICLFYQIYNFIMFHFFFKILIILLRQYELKILMFNFHQKYAYILKGRTYLNKKYLYTACEKCNSVTHSYVTDVKCSSFCEF